MGLQARDLGHCDGDTPLTLSPKPRASLSALRVLFPYLRPYRGRAVAAAVTLALAAGLVLLLGQGVRHLIDQGFASGNEGTLNRAALGMAAVVAALGLFTGARFYLMSWLGERVAADLRAGLFAQVLRLPPAFFETMRTGDVLDRKSVV